jgi:Uma2 family endonuclease
MANRPSTREEWEKLYEEQKDWQIKYHDRFGEFLPLAPWGVPIEKVIDVIKESLRTGKPYESPRKRKNVIL